MAAGLSRRFGSNKLLVEFRGKPLIHWSVAAALASRLDVVAVVLGNEHELAKAALADLSCTSRLAFVINNDFERGQSTSIVAGVAAVKSRCAAAMFIPADQPWLDAPTIDRLIEKFESGTRDICQPTCLGRRRSPVIFGASHFPELQRLEGDVGGRGIIDANPDRIAEVAFDCELPFLDVDYASDIDALAPQAVHAEEVASRSATTLTRALDLQTSSVIAICGAGGKTSLMAALTREIGASGERVLASTTTKLAESELDGPWQPLCAADADDVVAQAEKAAGPVLAYREVDHRAGKLIGYGPEVIDAIAERGHFDRIIIEADGSRGRPLKAPGENEPVIPSSTDAIVIVAGASGFGQPVDDRTIFRPDRWMDLADSRPPQTVTPDSLARVVAHPQGFARKAPPQARRILFINQVDTKARLEAARQTLRCVFSFDTPAIAHAAIGQLLPEPEIAYSRSRQACAGPREDIA